MYLVKFVNASTGITFKLKYGTVARAKRVVAYFDNHPELKTNASYEGRIK